MNWLKENWFKVGILIGFLILLVTLVFWSNYKYNRCVKINNEELESCNNGDLGNYDCAVFENAEEFCVETI